MAPRSISRSTDRPGAQAGFIVGTIRGPHGVRGEVRVYPESDVPERFEAGSVLECDGIGPLTVAAVRGTPEDPIVLFRGYTSRPAADVLRNRVLRVSPDEARRATKGTYLWADLIGLRAVTPEGAGVGIVREVLRAGGADVLVVRDDSGTELLLPMLATVVRDIDLARGRVTVTPLEEA